MTKKKDDICSHVLTGAVAVDTDGDEHERLERAAEPVSDQSTLHLAPPSLAPAGRERFKHGVRSSPPKKKKRGKKVKKTPRWRQFQKDKSHVLKKLRCEHGANENATKSSASK